MSRSLVGLAGFCTLALVLLGKMALNPRLYRDGFHLAMPATLVLAGGPPRASPSMLRTRWGGGVIFRAGAGAPIGAAVLFCLGRSDQICQVKDLVVGQGSDAILEYRPRIEPRAEAVQQVPERLEALVPPDGTLVAMPEGVMLNYLTRRASPTPYTTFMPTELAVYGEPAIVSLAVGHAARFRPAGSQGHPGVRRRFLRRGLALWRADHGVGPIAVRPGRSHPARAPGQSEVRYQDHEETAIGRSRLVRSLEMRLSLPPRPPLVADGDVERAV
jgi:hypothetical protein